VQATGFRLDNAGALPKDWVLPAAMERIRRRLAGADDGNRQMVDILVAVLADVILNILARQRDRALTTTILTP
jgi:hypothetical protein